MKWAFALALVCSACVGPGTIPLAQAYAEERSHVEVQAEGTIVRALGERLGPSGEHVGFLVRVRDGDPRGRAVRVEVNEDLTGPVVGTTGEPMTVRGEYEYDPRGGVIHWTHHDPRHRHADGYVVIAGRRYD